MKDITTYILEGVINKDIAISLDRAINSEKPMFINKVSGSMYNKVVDAVKDAAKKNNREYLEEHCDKLEAADFSKYNKQGHCTVSGLNTIMQNPNEKYVLFINFEDATPDVINAMMPIILKHRIDNKDYDNFIVIGYGDWDELSNPMQSRFGHCFTF